MGLRHGCPLGRSAHELSAGVPALQAASFHAMGSADVVTLNLNYWFLTLGFAAAVAGLLAPRVRGVILLPVLLLMLVLPGLTGIPVPGGADRPLAYLVATAALLVVLWLDERQDWQLAAATVLLGGAFLTKREGLVVGACVLVAALAASWSDRRAAPGRGWRRRGAAAFALALPWRIWVGTQDFPDEGLESGVVATLENTGRAWPSLELALRAMFGYDFWLVLPAVAVVAALLGLRRRCASAGGLHARLSRRSPSPPTPGSRGSQTFFGLTLDYSLNPATRFMVTPRPQRCGRDPLFLERAWTSASGERHHVADRRRGRLVLSWRGRSSSRRCSLSGVDAGGRLEPPASWRALRPSPRETNAAALRSTASGCVSSSGTSVPTWRQSLSATGSGAGFATTGVARDGCGRLRVFVEMVPSVGAGEALANEAEEAGLEPTLEQDPAMSGYPRAAMTSHAIPLRVCRSASAFSPSPFSTGSSWPRCSPSRSTSCSGSSPAR